jgi:hypothetical protein
MVSHFTFSSLSIAFFKQKRLSIPGEAEKDAEIREEIPRDEEDNQAD